MTEADEGLLNALFDNPDLEIYEPAPSLPADAGDAGDDQTIYTDWLWEAA